MDYMLVGNGDGQHLIRLSDIAYIEVDTLNPNDINYSLYLKYKDEFSDSESLKCIFIDKNTYEHIINKLMPEYLVEGYPLCAQCGGYPIPFSDPYENVQGVVCSQDKDHIVTCKYNARHCRAPLFDHWIEGKFGDVSNLCDC